MVAHSLARSPVLQRSLLGNPSAVLFCVALYFDGYLMVHSHITRIAKHQNRFRRVAAKNAGSYRLSVDCLTKEVLSSDGPPDTSQSRLFPLVLHHTGELVQSSVLSERTPKEKALKRCSVVKRFKKMISQHFPKPTKHPLRASKHSGFTPISGLKHIFKRSAT